MRILWLSHLIPYPPKGGVLQRAYYLLREAAKYHQVDLLAFNQPGLIGPLFNSVDEGVDEAKSHLGGFCNNLKFFDIQSEKSSFGRYYLAIKSLITKDPYNINWLKSAEYSNAVRQFIDESQYDLVHFDTISLIPFIEDVGNLPVVLDHHNIESHMLIRRGEKESNALKSWYFRQEGERLQRIEEEICKRVALNITCSDMDSERLFSISPHSRVESVPNGVDESFFLAADDDREIKNKLLFVGTLNWYPNIEAVNFIAENLWEKLKKEIPTVVFDIVGVNPPSSILSLSQSDANFQVHGFVDDVRTYFSAADIFVCPIQDGGGTKLKILDAMSMGKAIVAHPIACEGIAVVDNESVCFADTAEEYVEIIVRLLNDPIEIKRLGTAARKLIEDKYTYTAIGQHLSGLYESCIDPTAVQ